MCSRPQSMVKHSRTQWASGSWSNDVLFHKGLHLQSITWKEQTDRHSFYLRCPPPLTHSPGHKNVFPFFISKILHFELLEDLVDGRGLKSDIRLRLGRLCRVRVFETWSLESVDGFSGFCVLLVCKHDCIHEQLYILKISLPYPFYF